ncbi:MAG: hypothetical protein ACPIOQ_15555 [Promethearchaeia archaeon]
MSAWHAAAQKQLQAQGAPGSVQQGRGLPRARSSGRIDTQLLAAAPPSCPVLESECVETLQCPASSALCCAAVFRPVEEAAAFLNSWILRDERKKESKARDRQSQGWSNRDPTSVHRNGMRLGRVGYGARGNGFTALVRS